MSILEDVTSAVSTFVVAPMAAFGLGGFVFDTQGESVSNLSTEISDHYTEDNTAVQDHIAIRPAKIVLKGYVGELVFTPKGQTPSTVPKVAQKLTTVASYLPRLSSAAQQIQSGILSPSNFGLSDAADIYALVKDMLGAFGDMSNQQNAYNYFSALMNQKVLLGVQTPWSFMTNMAIESITSVQDEETRFRSDFSISLKQMRFAETTTTAFTISGSGSFQGAAAFQCTLQNPLGLSPGQPLPSGSLPGAQGIMTGVLDMHILKPILNVFQIGSATPGGS